MLLSILRLFILIVGVALGIGALSPTQAEKLTERPSPDVPGSIAAAVIAIVDRAQSQDIEGEIVLSRGVYLGNQIKVRFPSKLASLRIIGQGSSTVIDGISNEAVFFRLEGIRGRPTRLEIVNLMIRRYFTAVVLYGNREDPAKWNGSNTIRNVAFDDIGGRSKRRSTGAIVLVNSRTNFIERNDFVDVYNVDGCGAFHSIYMAHYSSENLVAANKFDQKCGDPVRIRDASSNNIFRGNVFLNPAPTAFYTEWFCDKTYNASCTKRIHECPPAGNVYEIDGRTIRSTAEPSSVYTDSGVKAFPRSCRCHPNCER